MLHVDADVLDYMSLPLAVGTATDRRPGLESHALVTVMKTICADPNWRGMTIAEVDPNHAPDPQESFDVFIEMLAEAIAG